MEILKIEHAKFTAQISHIAISCSRFTHSHIMAMVQLFSNEDIVFVKTVQIGDTENRACKIYCSQEGKYVLNDLHIQGH